MDIKLQQKDIILAALSASDRDEHSPVQVQKLLFLIDKKIASELGGPFFNFIAYDYGPFDKDIYNVLSMLTQEGLVETTYSSDFSSRAYRLTIKGQREGEKILKTFPVDTRSYLKKLSAFVRGLSFAELVSVIYNAYPEMKVNSVFRS